MTMQKTTERASRVVPMFAVREAEGSSASQSVVCMALPRVCTSHSWHGAVLDMTPSPLS